MALPVNTAVFIGFHTSFRFFIGLYKVWPWSDFPFYDDPLIMAGSKLQNNGERQTEMKINNNLNWEN